MKSRDSDAGTQGNKVKLTALLVHAVLSMPTRRVSQRPTAEKVVAPSCHTSVEQAQKEQPAGIERLAKGSKERSNEKGYVHGHDLQRASLLRVAVLAAPGADRVAKVPACVLDLCEVTHGDVCVCVVSL